MPNVNFTGTAITTISHSVTLNWTASASSNVVGYNVYRATGTGSYVKVNSSLVGSTTFVDSAVTGGQTYTYCATAVDGNNMESSYSTPVSATVPL